MKANVLEKLETLKAFQLKNLYSKFITYTNAVAHLKFPK
jgi:hypothetical protein